jgi:hypothetical protein
VAAKKLSYGSGNADLATIMRSDRAKKHLLFGVCSRVMAATDTAQAQQSSGVQRAQESNPADKVLLAPRTGGEEQ